MPKKSATVELVRRRAGEGPRPTEADMERIRRASLGPIDTSDIPEMKGPFHRIKRDALGRLPKKRESPIRDAILAALGRRKMTRYQLWKDARVHCETLPQSAVYEYLRGQREIGLPYAEALMRAVGLVVVPQRVARPRKAGAPATGRRKTSKALAR